MRFPLSATPMSRGKESKRIPPQSLSAAGRQPPSRWRSALMPIPRAGGFYASSWVDYLRRQAEAELPVARPTMALAGQALIDEVLLASSRFLFGPPDQGVFERIEREVLEALDVFSDAGWIEHPEGYFSAPPPMDDFRLEHTRTRQHVYERLSFESGYEPRPDEPGRARWLDYPLNRRGYAWLMRHEQPSPWLVCVHGAAMGRPATDLSLFRAKWLHERLGLNVLFPVLPLHGPRRPNLIGGDMYPGLDVLDNIHGTAQAVWDVRRLVSWIRSQDADAAIGFTGISLGGYVTSMTASLESGLACAIVGVPVVDLIDLIERHSGRFTDEELSRTESPARQLGRSISPLSLSPKVPPSGRFIYAGVGDRLVQPRRHVVRLWEHWGRPQIAWYQGGHTGFSRSKPVQRFVLAALVESGLVDAHVALGAI